MTTSAILDNAATVVQPLRRQRQWASPPDCFRCNASLRLQSQQTRGFERRSQPFNNNPTKNWAASCDRWRPSVSIEQHSLRSGERTVPRKQRKPGVWDSLDARLGATDKLARDFFSDAQAITSIGYTPTSQLELSDEELSEH